MRHLTGRARQQSMVLNLRGKLESRRYEDLKKAVRKVFIPFNSHVTGGTEEDRKDCRSRQALRAFRCFVVGRS